MDKKELSAKEDVCLSASKLRISETNELQKQEMERRQSQVNALQARFMEVKTSIQGSEGDMNKELEILRRRVKASARMLNYLKSKARFMALPDVAYTSCGIEEVEGLELADKNGELLCNWSNDVDLSSFDTPDERKFVEKIKQQGSLDVEDEAYVSELLKSVEMVSDVMDCLVKRAVVAESETAIQKEKVSLGLAEIGNKVIQIENLSLKLEEMKQFAQGTNSVLNEMRIRVEDLVEETTRQRQRAAENEEELCRVKRDFESLKSYVTTLTNVRETLLSSERQFQTMEVQFERLVTKTTQLEVEKVQKESEVQKLMEENVRLMALLDKKEAQLLAMNEQCKIMALNSSNV